MAALGIVGTDLVNDSSGCVGCIDYVSSVEYSTLKTLFWRLTDVRPGKLRTGDTSPRILRTEPGVAIAPKKRLVWLMVQSNLVVDNLEAALGIFEGSCISRKNNCYIFLTF